MRRARVRASARKCAQGRASPEIFISKSSTSEVQESGPASEDHVPLFRAQINFPHQESAALEHFGAPVRSCFSGERHAQIIAV